VRLGFASSAVASPATVDFPADCHILGERPVEISHRFKRALLGRGGREARNTTRVAFDNDFAPFFNQLVKDPIQIAHEDLSVLTSPLPVPSLPYKTQ